jgi:hypothetical protein
LDDGPKTDRDVPRLDGQLFRQSAGLSWVVNPDELGTGVAIAQGAKTLGSKQTAFDAEAVRWFEPPSWQTATSTWSLDEHYHTG